MDNFTKATDWVNSNPELLKKLLDEVFKAMEELFRPNMSLDEVAKEFSPCLDEIIIKNLKQGYNYSAGKFKIANVGLGRFKMSFDLYFRDKSGKWFNAKNESPAIDFKEYLSEAAIKELQAAGEKEYDVDAPQIKE